jgi:hypothetical protein
MLNIMLYPPRKLLAILLVVWLPLFSGNALADSIAMQNMRGNSHCATQISHSVERDSASHQDIYQTLLAGNENQSKNTQSNSCNNCGVCQLACNGYISSPVIEMGAVKSSSQAFTLFVISFQSVTINLLDPPPLVLA